MTSNAAAPVTAASLDRRQLATLGGAMLGFQCFGLIVLVLGVTAGLSLTLRAQRPLSH